MRHTWKYRLLAALLAVCTMFSVCLPAQAATIADGSKTVTVHNDTRHNYLTTTAGHRCLDRRLSGGGTGYAAERRSSYHFPRRVHRIGHYDCGDLRGDSYFINQL